LLAAGYSDLPGPLIAAGPIFGVVRDAVRALLLAVWDDRDHVRIGIHAGDSEDTEFHGILDASIPRIDGVPDLSQVIVVVTDVTALKQAEARMEKLVKSKDDFLAAVSHEIRTPLTSVFGGALVLDEQSGNLTAEETRELVGSIARESGEVADLVEDLLVAARADMGNINIGIRSVAVRPAVERVVAGIAAGPIHIDCSEVDGEVLADPLRFNQIVRNLLTNAVRYGGPQIAVQSAQIDGATYVSICDNGDGIDDDRHDAIFDLYERGGSRSTPTTSVGVGLTVSRQLARLMGGDVTYEHSGGWCRFRLELPSANNSVRS
jgi:signal transduction histidine kinase